MLFSKSSKKKSHGVSIKGMFDESVIAAIRSAAISTNEMRDPLRNLQLATPGHSSTDLMLRVAGEHLAEVHLNDLNRLLGTDMVLSGNTLYLNNFETRYPGLAERVVHHMRENNLGVKPSAWQIAKGLSYTLFGAGGSAASVGTFLEIEGGLAEFGLFALALGTPVVLVAWIRSMFSSKREHPHGA